VITQVDPNLLIAPGREKGVNGVDDRPETAHGHARRQPDHVGFGRPGIHKPSWRRCFKLVKQSVSNIAGDQNNPLVFFCESRYFRSERVSHRPNSLLPFLTSSAVGMR
jgi:hypothetical protein